MRGAPDGRTIARAVRVAQMQALQQVMKDYDSSFRRPKILRSSKINVFIERGIEFAASSHSHGINLQETIDVEAQVSFVALANEALALPARDTSSQERASRLAIAAEDAVLAELQRALHPLSLPRTFEGHFRNGSRGYSSFSVLFGRYLSRQIETNEAFRHVYSTTLLSQIERIATATHEALGRLQDDVGGLQADLRTGIANSASLLSAGDTLNFATTETYFGRRLSAETTFNHARPLVGREQIVGRIVEEVHGLLESPGVGIVSISAVGGSGKSRLLIEAARKLETDVSVRWVRDGVDVTLDALSQLPPGPLLLICDDAQRRSDLTSLLQLADARKDRTAILVSTRPYGRDALQSCLYGANVSFDRLRDLGELPEVPIEDLLPVVAAELGSEYRHLADDVLRLAGGSILVALVAARLLQKRQLDPRGVVLDPEFRTTVLEGFKQETMGAVPGSLDSEAARRVMEILAAVQPISLHDEEFERALASYVGVEVSVLRRIIGALVEGGVVRDDHSGYRIVPDVLGDHVLNSAMVTQGKATTLDAEILEALGSTVLVNVVRNVAELDWQRTAAGHPTLVFTRAWDSFEDTFRVAPNWKRKNWLEHLHPVAAFQPEAMLQFAKTFVANPVGDDQPQGYFNVRTTNAEVIHRLAPLLAIVAQHEKHTVEALDLLWNIGRTDERQTNPYPDHAIRQMAEVVAYSRRRHIWMQERALDALERWLSDPSWSRGFHSPLLIAKAVLESSMMEHRFSERDSSVTMMRFGVNAETTRAVRLRAVAILERLVAESGVRGRHLALGQLLDALHRPDGALGHEVSTEEEESFRDQYLATLDAIERLVRRGLDPLALVAIRTDLRSSARFTLLPWKAERMRAVAAMVEESSATRLISALAHSFKEWDPEQDSHEDHERRWIATVRETVAELVNQSGPAETVALTLGNACDLYNAAGAEYEPGFLLHTLAEGYPEIAREIAVWSLRKTAAGEAAHPEWLTPLLGALRTKRPDVYTDLLKHAAASEEPKLRQVAAAAVYRVLGESRRSNLELEVIRRLMADPDLNVVRTALASLAFTDVEQVDPLLSAVRLHGDIGAAERLAEAWAMRREERLPNPDEATTRHLLSELTLVPDLGRAQWDVSRMVAAMACHYPEAIIDFLTARVVREHAWIAEEEFDLKARYDAIPYRGFEGLQESLRKSERYEEIIERLLQSLNRSLDGVIVRNDVAHAVLSTMDQWDDVLERMVRRWIDARECERLRNSGLLFEQMSRDFVLRNRLLVADLLEAVEACGQEIRLSIERSLELSAFGDDVVVRTVGEPHPVTLRLASEAEAAAPDLSMQGRAIGAAFYSHVAERARKELEVERLRDELARGSK